MRPDSERLALADEATLRAWQRAALRCMAACAEVGLPADEPCASWADRCQDELERRTAGMPLPGPLAERMRARYGRTGPRDTEGGAR